jgi:predicted nucleic acid-binding Zn ribbon protein
LGVNKEIIDWKNSTKLKDGTAMASTNLSIFKIISIGLFGLFFGLFETFTNLVYILTNNYRWSRLQHGKEIPIQAEDKVIKRKVVQMFLLGIMLLSITYISLLISPQLFVVGSVLIFLSGLLDYSRYRKKNFLLIWTIIAIISFLLVFLP